MPVVSFTDQNFEEMVTKNDGPVLVDFYADWCGPCRAVAPIIEELSGTYEGKVLVGKVDVDANTAVAGKFEVMSIPTVILFDKGVEVERQVGFGGKDMYLNMVKKVLK